MGKPHNRVIVNLLGLWSDCPEKKRASEEIVFWMKFTQGTQLIIKESTSRNTTYNALKWCVEKGALEKEEVGRRVFYYPKVTIKKSRTHKYYEVNSRFQRIFTRAHKKVFHGITPWRWASTKSVVKVPAESLALTAAEKTLSKDEQIKIRAARYTKVLFWVQDRLTTIMESDGVCPFCGSKGLLRRNRDSTKDFVVCEKCDSILLPQQIVVKIREFHIGHEPAIDALFPKKKGLDMFRQALDKQKKETERAERTHRFLSDRNIIQTLRKKNWAFKLQIEEEAKKKSEAEAQT